MSELIVACVRVGQKYGAEYVHRLQNAVARHLSVPHRFVCLTDAPSRNGAVQTVYVDDLPGWWAKMALFRREWRRDAKVIYLDLDSVIVGSLDPLAAVTAPFAVCANFTVLHQQRLAVTGGGGRASWPCRYGSMCMVLGENLDDRIWREFEPNKQSHFARNHDYGDQKSIEEIEPDAAMLQDLLPPGFFLGYRDLAAHGEGPPPGAAVIVFAGKNKPHNTQCEWARLAWKQTDITPSASMPAA